MHRRGSSAAREETEVARLTGCGLPVETAAIVAANGHAAAVPSSVMNSRRLVCRESSIVRVDGGWFIRDPVAMLPAST